MKTKSLLPELVSHEELFWLFDLETRLKENVTNEYWGTIFLLQCKLLKKLLSTATAAAEVISEIKFGRPAWATFWGAWSRMMFIYFDFIAEIFEQGAIYLRVTKRAFGC